MSGPQGAFTPSREPTQVRGVLAERVIVSTPLDPFLSLKALASYSGLSVRKLRDLLVDPTRLLPHYRVGGKILVRRSEFDGWMQQYRPAGNTPEGNTNVARVVDNVLGSLKPS
jgi:excisionase family DNA binding protein